MNTTDEKLRIAKLRSLYDTIVILTEEGVISDDEAKELLSRPVFKIESEFVLDTMVKAFRHPEDEVTG